MKSSRLGVCLVSLLLGASAACDRSTDVSAPIGLPLPGLTNDQLARFRAGEAQFNRIFSPEEGLGPLFNENQCSACHTDPAAGGTGEQVLLRATRFTPPHQCDALAREGGENVRTRATPALEAHGVHRQMMPSSATEQGRFTVTFLFGLGLVEGIPEADILRREDPDDRDGDGISGRAGRDAAGNVARFGRKAETATIPDFIETALRFEMGLTTPRHLDEPLPSAHTWPQDIDPALDPEIDDATLSLLHDFVRLLAPPARRAPLDDEHRRTMDRGEALFDAIGCTACHVPAMRTGRNDVAALDRKTVYLYSDLLLHDLGPALVGACGLNATPTEYRTAMLMGLGHRRQYLHDGRTRDLFEAIFLHGGEAAAAREQFRSLDRLQQEAVIRFLSSL